MPLFEVAPFKIAEDQKGENRTYHNPTLQRGIFGNTGDTPKLNPSLTCRVGILAFAQLQT